MKTYLSLSQSTIDETITFNGCITSKDMIELTLNGYDRQLMNLGTDKNDPLWASHVMLVLEMLFRRIAEQSVKKNPAEAG